MEASLEIPKISCHARSISLPSSSHPLEVGVEDSLRRLRASQAGPSAFTSTSSSTMSRNLCVIKDLYEQMNDSIHLPMNQRVLSNDIHRDVVEEVLDGTLLLLDISGSSLDSLNQMKESILDLKSSLRRKSDEGINAYMMSRKKIIKKVSKCLVSLTKSKKSFSKLEKSGNHIPIIRMLKEAEEISLSTFKTILAYMSSRTKVISQPIGWSLVAKLVKSKRATCDTKGDINEVESIDHALCALSDKKSSLDMNALLKQLETLEMAINELEECLESSSRCLVKTRVSLLNVLNH